MFCFRKNYSAFSEVSSVAASSDTSSSATSCAGGVFLAANMFYI